MPRTIMGLETRACINGLTKTDFENVKQIPVLESETNQIKNTTIPALDDRITALEQGGSGGGSEWEEVDVSTYNKAHAQVNTLFDYDGDHYFTKNDMIIWYNNTVYCYNKNGNIQNENIRYHHITTTTANISIVEDSLNLSNVFINTTSQGGNYFNYYQNVVKINRTDSTITYESNYYYNNRNKIRVFVKKT